jgi:signal transduction histidine kinase
VAHERLGLFDTPPDRREIRLSLAIIGLLFATLCLIFPLRDAQLGEIKAFVPLVDASMLFSELIIATLLYAQATVFRSRALTVLASGYVFAALILVPHALTFPGAFAQNGLLGAGVNTTAWLAIFRRVTFPTAVIFYVLLKSADSAPQTDPKRPPARVLGGLAGAIVLAALGTLLTTGGHDLLPPIFLNHRDTVHTSLVIVNSVTILLTIAAMALLLRQDKSVLDLWLLVALSGWIFQSLLNVTLHTRFTLGWYGLNGMTLASSFIIMLALIAETSWLYARLALLTAARNRERETRLMSMDAVTAAISHEVGQPLTALSLSASVGLHWLTQPRPDISKAIRSLRAISDDSKRTFDVIKSIRAMFGKGGGPVSVFNLNDLVRETASVMDRELAGARVSLVLALDESLPPIRADQVQIQRVLINLVTNSIESLGPIRGRTRLLPQSRLRRITIRSASLGGQVVQLNVSDTGSGIPAEELEHIFDPFYTTKASGTGLGLSLCRSIVEDHHGRLWASQGEDCGAIFHLELPCSLSAINEISKTRSLAT